MAIVLGIVAFFLALGALWLANDAMKKVESKNDDFVRAYISEIKGSVEDSISAAEENTKTALALKERLKALEKDATDMKNASGDKAVELDNEIKILRSDIGTLGSEVAKFNKKLSKLAEPPQPKKEKAPAAEEKAPAAKKQSKP
ncbi:MAG: hypothetical protein V3R66_00810 [Rhodospirillales bacterium]